MKKEVKKNRFGVTLSMGLALFASLFGAGNLIFPPLLGAESGKGWMTGFLGFFLMDACLAAITVYAVIANRTSSVDGIVNKIGKLPGKIMMIVIILCIGPGIAIPRTAVTTYELGVHTLLPGLPQWAFGAFFFALTLIFVIRPSKVVDIVGNFLTPVLLAVMVLLIVVGIVHPIAMPVAIPEAQPLRDGIMNGYQTMDGLAAVLFTMMLVTAASAHGFTEKGQVKKMVAGADILACVLLGLVYGGLTYLGAAVSGQPEFAGLAQAPLLIAITNKLLGGFGVIALAIIVLMACLTTAIGLTSVAGEYFEKASNGKLKYKPVVITVIILSYAMSNFDLTTIIGIAAPILSVLYPPVIVLVVMTLFEKWIGNDRIIGAAAYTALAVSFCEIIGLPVIGEYIANLPLSGYGLAWITPAMVIVFIGILFFRERETYPVRK